MSAPFRVTSTRTLGVTLWTLWAQYPRHRRFVCQFRTQGEAIDYAYRNWPWWP